MPPYIDDLAAKTVLGRFDCRQHPRTGGASGVSTGLSSARTSQLPPVSSKLETYGAELLLTVLGRSKAAPSPRRRPFALGPCAAPGLRSLNRRMAPSGAILGGRYSRPYTLPGLLEPRKLLSPRQRSSGAQKIPIRDLLARRRHYWRRMV